MGHFLVPAVIRDILETCDGIQKLQSEKDTEDRVKAMKRENAVAISRIVIAASAAFAFFALNIPSITIPIAFLIGSVISLPTTLITSGLILGYMGVSTIIASISPFIFSSFAMGLGFTTLSLLALEMYKPFCLSNGRVGMGERLSQKFEHNELFTQH